jgi:Cu/Ag efflux pump CusA
VAGTKAQLILKLFGENIDVLKSKADEIAKILSTIKGGTDLAVEKVSGQPYLTIDIERSKIARYGLNISDVQNIIEIAIAGKSASKFYEENRSFDIVVRLPDYLPGAHKLHPFPLHHELDFDRPADFNRRRVVYLNAAPRNVHGERVPLL